MKIAFYAFNAYAFLTVILIIAYYYVFEFAELVNKSKVSTQYFRSNQIKVEDRFFTVLNKKIFAAASVVLFHIISLVPLLIISILVCVRHFETSEPFDSKLFGIVAASFAFVVPIILYSTAFSFLLRLWNRAKRWENENKKLPDERYIKKVKDEFEKSNIFEKERTFLYFDPENNNKGLKHSNKKALRKIRKNSKDLDDYLYYLIIFSYNTTTINNLFYEYEDVYSEYKTFMNSIKK